MGQLASQIVRLCVGHVRLLEPLVRDSGPIILTIQPIVKPGAHHSLSQLPHCVIPREMNRHERLRVLDRAEDSLQLVKIKLGLCDVHVLQVIPLE